MRLMPLIHEADVHPIVVVSEQLVFSPLALSVWGAKPVPLVDADSIVFEFNFSGHVKGLEGDLPDFSSAPGVRISSYPCSPKTSSISGRTEGSILSLQN
jgi:hypothetical protein